jgi:hypothetical protein
VRPASSKRIGSVLIYQNMYPVGFTDREDAFMRWIIAEFAAVALAVLCLSLPAPIFSSEASAGIMNGRGNCSGGVCTGGGTIWSSGANRPPSSKTTPKTKK